MRLQVTGTLTYCIALEVSLIVIIVNAILMAEQRNAAVLTLRCLTGIWKRRNRNGFAWIHTDRSNSTFGHVAGKEHHLSSTVSRLYRLIIPGRSNCKRKSWNLILSHRYRLDPRALQNPILVFPKSLHRNSVLQEAWTNPCFLYSEWAIPF